MASISRFKSSTQFRFMGLNLADNGCFCRKNAYSSRTFLPAIQLFFSFPVVELHFLQSELALSHITMLSIKYVLFKTFWHKDIVMILFKVKPWHTKVGRPYDKKTFTEPQVHVYSVIKTTNIIFIVHKDLLEGKYTSGDKYSK